MNEFDLIAIQQIIRDQCGKGAKFQIYNRSFKSPMKFVLDLAEEASASKFMVYWVEGGLPENFCLLDFEEKPVVFNTRFLEMTGLIRSILTEDRISEDMTVELSERLCLKIMAEFSLRDGVPDIAAFLMQKSIQGQTLFLSEKNLLMQIEAEPLSERYMVFWFFGLLHELGHFSPEMSEAARLPEDHPLSDQAIATLVNSALELFPYPDDLKKQAMDWVYSPGSDNILAAQHLREEALADMFATRVLFFATEAVLQRSNIEFDLVQFIYELGLFLNVIAVINRCKKVARTARPEDMNRNAAMATAFHPVAIAVRLNLLRDFLALFFATTLSSRRSETLTQSKIDEWSKHITELLNQLKPSLDLMEKGLAKAMRYVFFPNERDSNIGTKLFNELADTKNPSRIILKDFLALAESLDVISPFLLAIQLMVDDDLRKKGQFLQIQ